MAFEATTLDSSNPNYPAKLRPKRIQAQFPIISAIGNLDILKTPLLGFFCSVKCPGDLILRTYDLARALRDAGVPVISGFHSPIEKDCLDLLLRGSQPIAICPARSIEKMRLDVGLKENIDNGRVLVLSPFEINVKRATVEASRRRNQFVGALATAVFVAYADAGGKTEEFCKAMLKAGTPLYTFESQYNKTIVDAGAKPIDTKKLAQWAGSLYQMVQGE
jgi:predicted Rossmann fold nucleotide-binding protein DprA/Smf involved in DNA uptake